MKGWSGKILRIDLSEGSHWEERPNPEIYLNWIGGKGLSGFFLSDHVTLPWDNPSIPLLLFTGPLVGTASPTSGRMTVMSRSPLTGAICDASVGGKFGTEIKKAGWDGIIITGQSSEPLGIEIEDDRVSLVDAQFCMGLGIPEIANLLEGRGAYAATGPAADKGVRFSNLMFDGHYTAGRGGLGLSFAVKGIKYLTVKGTGEVEVADKAGLKKAREDIFRLTAASPAVMGDMGITHFGTGALYDLTDARRMMPTNNFRQTHFDGASAMNAYSYKTRYKTKKAGCRGCHILCKKRGEKGEVIPEFETMSHFSALLGNCDLESVVEANRICNDMGMDTISAASTLACYSEITGKKLEGPAILRLLEDIALGTGEQTDLAEGSYRYAETCGRSELSMTVKKLELPAYDPRGAYGMALAYAVSTRGGCHLRAYPISNEILRKPVATDRFTFSGKARMVKIAEDMNAVVDSLTACKFVFFAASLEEYAKAFTAVTGIPSSAQDLLRIGERIYYHERMMNYRIGFRSRDDDLPSRFFEAPGSSGNNITVKALDRSEFLQTRANYYKVRGLSYQGAPTRQRAVDLGIEWKN